MDGQPSQAQGMPQPLALPPSVKAGMRSAKAAKAASELADATAFEDELEEGVSPDEESPPRLGQAPDRMGVSSRAVAVSNFFRMPRQSVRVLYSTWVVNLRREKDHYTAGPCWSICAAIVGFLLVGLLAVIYLLMFCRIEIAIIDNNDFLGYGDVVFKEFITTGSDTSSIGFTVGTIIAGSTLLLWCIIYLFDVRSWKNAGSIFSIFGKIILAIGVGMIFVSSVFVTDRFLAAPFMAYIGFSIFVYAGVKVAVFPTVQKLIYINALRNGGILCGLIMLALWAYYIFHEKTVYTITLQAHYQDLLGCDEPTPFTYEELVDDPALLTNFTAEGNTLPSCDVAFLIWLAPFIYIFGALVFSGVLNFLSRAEYKRMKTEKPVGLEPMAQVFLAIVLLSFLGLWVAASIAAATAALANTILSLSFASLLAIMTTSVAVFGVKYIQSQAKETSIGKKAFQFFESDWGKGLLVVTCLPIIASFLLLDFVTHFIRKYTCLRHNLTEDERKMLLSPPIQQAVDTMRRDWERGSIITKAIIWGIGFFVFSVGVTRITIVFLSYIRELLKTGLLKVTLILMAVGLIIFLLPPVPGVPVYILAGVILPTVAGEETGMSFGWGIIFSIAVSLFLKLLALVLQQKMIGEWWGSRSVQVRYTVGVNSVEIRAIKKILEVNGYTKAKIAILCGGPDWPTSVLTGILKLNVWQMLLGTVPVVFLIAPCVVSGAMLVKSGENPNDSLFSSLNSISIFLSVVFQSAAILVAAQYIAAEAVRSEAELRALPKDMAVWELEKRDRARSFVYQTVTSWKHLGIFWKIMHVLNLCCMIMSCYAFQFAGSKLFVAFSVTDSIAEKLDGNVLNLVNTAGWIFHGLFFIPTIYYFIFKAVHKRKGLPMGVEMPNFEDETFLDAKSDPATELVHKPAVAGGV